MLIKLKMRKWRKHEDKEINFTAGLNAIRGANENGKTSMLWAIAYALWGSKVLPLPMDDMVTWGFPVKEAKVDLVFSKNGELYQFVRGTTGAECHHSGGIVTGQNEVSKFATELLGVSGDLAMKLMFAPQGDLRGALNSGPSAISTYIEDMSGMDLFERLLELISEKLVTGPTTRLDSEIAALEDRQALGGPVEPDLSEKNHQIAVLTSDLHVAEQALQEAEPKAVAANDAYTQAKAAADVRTQALQNLNRAEVNRDRRLEQKEADLNAAAVEVDEARIAELERLVGDANAQEARKSAYGAFSKLKSTETEWEGDETSLKAAIEAARVREKSLNSQIALKQSDIREFKAQMVTSSVCGFCNQDMSQFPEVAKKNADLTANIEANTKSLDGLLCELNDVSDELGTLREVYESADPVKSFLQRYSQYVTVDTNFVPPHVEWVGDVPGEDLNAAAYKSKLAAAKGGLAAKVAAQVRLVEVEKSLAQDEQVIAELKKSVPPEVDLDDLYRVKLQADTVVADYTKCIRKAREDIQMLEGHKSRMIAEYEVAKRTFAQIAVDITTKRAERDSLLFNNTLVKKIRAARPIVAAKLWSMVLTSVSTMFSTMRGIPSVVTKGKDGFLVDGRPAKALSGSALDLLGFAIRVAMLKTFIPDNPFMILDEATAACDDERTESLLGFIAGAGFQQTLLVTHEAASESVADNVVMI